MSIYELIHWGFRIYEILIIIYIFMSWIPQARYSALGTGLEKITEPYLSIFRRFIPPIGFLDLSPIVALLALEFVKIGLITVIDWMIRGEIM